MNAFIEKLVRKRDAQKEETRQRILAVARVHFERDGFDGANLRAIAAEANVAAGTVLLHFKDKHDLLHAALFDDLAQTIETSVSTKTKGKLETRLLAVVKPFFEYYASRPKLSKTLLREALLADSPWRERFTGQVVRVHAHVASLVVAAKEREEIPATVDPMIFGAAFFSFYYFALIGWVQGGVSAPSPLFERLLADYMRGVHAQLPPKRKDPK